MPLRLHQRLADENLPRQHRIGLGKRYPPTAVDHQAIEGGSLKRHHIAVPRLPMRVQQLFLQQVGAHLLQPCRLDVGDAATKQARGLHQLGTHQPLAGLFAQMHTRVAVELDAASPQINVFLVLLATDVAQQAAQHGQMQMLIAGGLLVHHPALLFHHGEELAVHIAPFAPTADVDEVLPQQVLVLAVGEFVGCDRLLRFARHDAPPRRLQPIPQAQIAAELAFVVLELGMRLVGLGLRLHGAVTHILHTQSGRDDQHLVQALALTRCQNHATHAGV